MGGGGGGVTQFLSVIFCQFWHFGRGELTKTDILVYPGFPTYNIALTVLIVLILIIVITINRLKTI